MNGANRLSALSRRRAGILLHPTSLPGRFGVGDLGPEADRFLSWARSAGQSLWQVLPLHPTGPGDSPYGAASAFAGNPLLISPEGLVEDGYLPGSALDGAPAFPEGRLDSAGARQWKEKILRASWEHSGAAVASAGELAAFQRAEAQASWLPDWSLFAALKRKHQGPWTSWPEELRRRRPEALAAARRDLSEDIRWQEYRQFLFYRQWTRLRAAANGRGIAILGDVPIYVSHDSADVWARQDLFLLDSAGMPEAVAGVPPDAFSETGQLWGYPVYRWDAMERDGFRWWIARLRHALSIADVARIDHFRGFAAGWSVPASETSAIGGRWVPGPGVKLFEAVRRDLGDIPLVAEDLGVITGDVRALLSVLGIPGMKVLQFGFSQDDSEHLPHRHVANAVVYTGTHDNDTTRGWFAALSGPERRRVLDYVGGDGTDIARDFIREASTSVAGLAVVPLQDVLGLGSEARMNTPGVAQGNWSWRVLPGAFTAERAEGLKRLARLTGRVEENS
jgi:4-alpha-glucanotransferase